MNTLVGFVLVAIVVCACAADSPFDDENVKKLALEKFENAETQKRFTDHFDQLKPCFQNFRSMSVDAQNVAKDMYFQTVNNCKKETKTITDYDERISKYTECANKQLEVFKGYPKVSTADGENYEKGVRCIIGIFKAAGPH